MTWLLDADVLSQPAKSHGDARVIAWLRQEQDNCYTSAIVMAQLAYWVRTKPGRQRDALQAWLTRLLDAMHGRIYSFNVSVAHVWGRATATARRRRPTDAGTATSRRSLAATDSRWQPATTATFAVRA